MPKLGISATELSRTAELILTRMPWDEVTLFVAANRSGIRYREAVGVALGWIATLLEEGNGKEKEVAQPESGCNMNGSGSREDVVVESGYEEEGEEGEEEELEGHLMENGKVPVAGGWVDDNDNDDDDNVYKQEETSVWEGYDDEVNTLGFRS